MSLMTQVGMEFIARDRSRGGINSFNRNLRTTSNAVQMLSRNLLAVAGVGGGVYMLRNILAGSISGFADFEKSMAKVSTMLDEQTMNHLPRYNAEIRRMSVEYGEAAENLSTGLYDILSAQIEAAGATKVLEQSMRSAKGGFTSAATTTKANVQILKAYGWEVDQISRINDIMHATVQQGRFTFEDYASTIGDIIGLAAYLKIDLEAVGASIATMTKAGLSSEKAITALKNIFNQFLYPTEQARQVAAELGFSLDETTIRGKGLINIMEGLKNANARQLETLMPSIRGLVGFASQLKNASEVASDYEKIVNSQGLAQINFEKAMATTSTEIDIAKQQYEEMKRVVGEELAPAFTSLMKSMTEWAKQGEFKALIHENIAMLYEFGDAVTNLDELFKSLGLEKWKKTYRELADEQWKLADLARKNAQPPPPVVQGPTQEVSDEDMWLSRMPQIEAEYVEVVKLTNAQILADTREQLASVRAMHDKTRMEKIRCSKITGWPISVIPQRSRKVRGF